MSQFYSEGVRCKPSCIFPWVTDLIGEVCVCDASSGYVYDPTYPIDSGCRLDCPQYTGDNYRVSYDNRICN